MTMRTARLLVVVVGIVLPYLARLPGGMDWLGQFTDVDAGGWLFFAAFNAIGWVAILGASFLYRRPAAVLAPALAGFGFLAWAYGTLDLAADAQAAVALVFIPLVALVPILAGTVIGVLVDRRLRRCASGRDARATDTHGF